jgi:hypothetical protein
MQYPQSRHVTSLATFRVIAAQRAFRSPHTSFHFHFVHVSPTYTTHVLDLDLDLDLLTF